MLFVFRISYPEFRIPNFVSRISYPEFRMSLLGFRKHVSECCAITQKRCPPMVKDKEKVMFRSSRRISHGTDLRQSVKYDYTASCEVHAATSIDLSSD